MHIQVDTTGLALALKKIAVAVDEQKHSNYAAKLAAKDGKLVLEGGGTLWAVATIPAQVIEPGTVELNAKWLAGIVAQLRNNVDVDMKVIGADKEGGNPGKLALSDGRMPVRMGLLPEGTAFLRPQNLPEPRYKIKDIDKKLAAVATVVDTSIKNSYETNVLQNVNIRVAGGKVLCSATDRFRVLRVAADAPAGMPECNVVVSPSWIRLIRGADAIGISDRMANAHGGVPDLIDWQVSTPLFDKQFPQVDQLFKAGDTRVVVDCDAFSSAVRRLGAISRLDSKNNDDTIYATGKDGRIALKLGTGDDPDAPQAGEYVDTFSGGDGFAFSFSARLLASLLAILSGKVSLALAPSGRVAVLTDDQNDGCTAAIAGKRRI